MAQTATISKSSLRRVERFVDNFIRSEYMQAYQESAISSDYAIGRRFGRCMDAAENGADGSTHAEVISDWRGAFSAWLRDRRRGSWSADPDRFSAAIEAHFDSVEEWHYRHGSLDKVVG